jgi:hypothetical protein
MADDAANDAADAADATVAGSGRAERIDYDRLESNIPSATERRDAGVLHSYDTRS